MVSAITLRRINHNQGVFEDPASVGWVYGIHGLITETWRLLGALQTGPLRPRCNSFCRVHLIPTATDGDSWENSTIPAAFTCYLSVIISFSVLPQIFWKEYVARSGLSYRVSLRLMKISNIPFDSCFCWSHRFWIPP